MVLMPFKIAAVAASSIPITIFISLGAFLVVGLELNTVTLAALIVTLGMIAVSYTHLRAHETVLDLVCRLLLEKKKRKQKREI